jgi:DNA (cytosine-5)-methyltransferase 1
MGLNDLSLVDLFSGAGGFLVGFKKAGYNPIFCVENWAPCIETHEYNFPKVKLINKSIEKISNSEIKKHINGKKIDVIVGGPPCQGFSTIGKRLIKDPRNKLVFEFIRFLKIIKPKVFLMENVRGLASSKNGKTRQLIEKEFVQAGYHNVNSNVLCAADYGIPQLRYRVFFIGVRKDLDINIELPQFTHSKKHYNVVGNSIMDLVGKENKIPNHIPMNHNEIVRNRMKYIPEGGGLPKNGVPQKYIYGSRSDYANNRLKNFSHIYKRLHRKRPSTTMVPGHNAFPLHPTENRALTVREAARIQTFDDDIVFKGTRQEQCIQVGNAVPVKLASIFAKHIKSSLNGVTPHVK